MNQEQQQQQKQQQEQQEQVSVKDIRKGYEDAFMTLMSNPEYASLSFYSFILAKMQVSFNKAVGTAGAGFYNNNYQLVINPDFFNALPREQAMGVLIHETLHVILKHIFRKGERDHRMYNMAADIALNQGIKREMLPEGALYPDTFKFKENCTAEQYYEMLKKEKEKQEKEKEEWEKQNGESQDCPNCGGTGKEPQEQDQQDQGEGGEKEDQEGGEKEDQEGQGQGQGQEGSEPCSCCGGHGQDPESRWPGPVNGNPDLTGNNELTIDSHEAWEKINEEDEELAAQMMEKAINEAMEKSRGNVPGNMEQILDLWKRKAKVSWKKVLKKYVSSLPGAKQTTIKRRDRRQPKRSDIKGKKTYYDQPIVVVGIDTSGSMSDQEVVDGLVEINEVCKITGSKLKVAQIDTNIKSLDDYDPKKTKFMRKGYGGTYMGAMAEYLHENKVKYDVLVMISDMEIENVAEDQNWKNLKKPTLWLSTRGVEVDWESKKHKVMDISKA